MLLATGVFFAQVQNYMNKTIDLFIKMRYYGLIRQIYRTKVNTVLYLYNKQPKFS